jgi:hypothetical protein
MLVCEGHAPAAKCFHPACFPKHGVVLRADNRVACSLAMWVREAHRARAWRFPRSSKASKRKMAMQAMGWWHVKRRLSPKQKAAAEDAAQGGLDQPDDDVTHHSCLAGSGAVHSSEHNGILFSHTFFRQVASVTVTSPLCDTCPTHNCVVEQLCDCGDTFPGRTLCAAQLGVRTAAHPDSGAAPPNIRTPPTHFCCTTLIGSGWCFTDFSLLLAHLRGIVSRGSSVGCGCDDGGHGRLGGRWTR